MRPLFSLSTDAAGQKTYEEQIRGLADQLFEGDHSFRQSVAGSLGVLKGKCAGQSLDEACDYFSDNYTALKYSGARWTKLQSKIGREYVRLYLHRWFQ